MVFGPPEPGPPGCTRSEEWRAFRAAVNNSGPAHPRRCIETCHPPDNATNLVAPLPRSAKKHQSAKRKTILFLIRECARRSRIVFRSAALVVRPIVQHANGTIEPEHSRPCRNLVRVLRLSDGAPQNGIDRHIERGVFFQPFEFPVQNLQALLRYFIRLHVVDTDLKIIESGCVQPLDSLRRQQVTRS